jgi:DNA-binding transcriptional MerR regulator
MLIDIGPYTGTATTGLPKIQIIKHIRYLAGMTLKEAKDCMEKCLSGTQTVEMSSIVDSKCDAARKAVSELQGMGIETQLRTPHGAELNRVKTIVKEGIDICTAIEEPEMLEVFAVLFKMVCEKR